MVRKNIKSSFCVFLSFLIICTTILSINLTTIFATEKEFGNVSFVTPGENDSYTTYNAQVYFAQLASWGGYGTVGEGQTCDVTYEYADGTSKTESTSFLAVYDSELSLSKLYADLSDIPAACTVTVNNVQVVRNEQVDSWKNYAATDGAVILESNDSTEIVTPLFDGLQPIASNSTTMFEFESSGGTGGSGGEEEKVENRANAVINIPNDDAEKTYSAHIYITREGQWGNIGISAPETFDLLYQYPDGSEQTVSTQFAVQYDSQESHSELYVNLEDIEAGTTITVKQIPTCKDEGIWDDYLESYIGVELESSDVTETITTLGDEQKLLTDSADTNFEFESTFGEVTPDPEKPKDKYASVSVQVPTTDVEDKTYSMHFSLTRYDAGGANVNMGVSETYSVKYSYPDGTEETIENTLQPQYDSINNYSEVYFDVANLVGGTVVEISDIKIEKYQEGVWDNYILTNAKAELKSTDELETIKAIGNEYKSLVANETQNFEFQSTFEQPEEEKTDKFANVEIQIPTDGAATETYDLHLNFIRFTEHGDMLTQNDSEMYEVTYMYPDSSEETKITKFNCKYDSDVEQSQLYLDVNDLEGGTKVIVHNVQIAKEQEQTWKNYVSTKAQVELLSSDITQGFEAAEGNSKTLISNETTTFNFERFLNDVKNETDETFESLGGEYDVLYLMSNYNAISLDDIEATHIVGPIISQDGAFRTDENAFKDDATTTGHSDLVASDYSKGVSSYVGDLSSIPGDPSTSALQLGYGFDRLYHDNFQPPEFYTRSTEFNRPQYDILIQERIKNDEEIDYIMLEHDGSDFISPNDLGKVDTLQSDEFIDFTNLKEIMMDASDILIADGSLEREREIHVLEDPVEVLTITAGESWTIKDASQLRTVNILLPDVYDYYTNPWLDETTINILDETINPTQIDSKLHSRFPIVLVEGEQITIHQGENGEYGEVGNKIIWNVPNVVTNEKTGHNRMSFYGSGSNVAGHILAPNAEIWNYSENANGVQWEGGNINGSILAADIHSGNMEMHMWPYSGAAEGGTFTSVEVEKEFTNGDLTTSSFEFELSKIEGENYDGLLNLGFPLKAKTDENGLARFQTIIFDQEGTYHFNMKEVVPLDTQNINFDLSEYKVTIVVTQARDGHFHTALKYLKIKDAQGNILENPIEVDSLAYQNVRYQELPINYTLTKTDQHGFLLSGAVFEVSEVTSIEDNTVVENGYFSEIISSNSGKIFIEDLEKGKYYKLVETQAPIGHIAQDGYWIIAVDEVGRITTHAKGGAADIVGKKITNICIEEFSVDLTLYKKNEFDRLLAGAEFRVYQIVSLEDHRALQGGYDQNITVDSETGEVNITDLETSCVYMLVETKAPEGYMLETGSWIISVIRNDDQTSSIEYISIAGAPDIVDNTIINYMQEFELPETGSVGTTLYFTIGMVLSCLALVVIASKVRKNKLNKTIF